MGRGSLNFFVRVVWCVCVEVQKVEVLTVKDLDKIYSVVKAKLKLLQVVKEDRSMELQLSSEDTPSLLSLIEALKFHLIV